MNYEEIIEWLIEEQEKKLALHEERKLLQCGVIVLADDIDILKKKYKQLQKKHMRFLALKGLK